MQKSGLSTTCKHSFAIDAEHVMNARRGHEVYEEDGRPLGVDGQLAGNPTVVVRVVRRGDAPILVRDAGPGCDPPHRQGHDVIPSLLLPALRRVVHSQAPNALQLTRMMCLCANG